jgi:hypothetical protein
MTAAKRTHLTDGSQRRIEQKTSPSGMVADVLHQCPDLAAALRKLSDVRQEPSPMVREEWWEKSCHSNPPHPFPPQPAPFSEPGPAARHAQAQAGHDKAAMVTRSPGFRGGPNLSKSIPVRS